MRLLTRGVLKVESRTYAKLVILFVGLIAGVWWKTEGFLPVGSDEPTQFLRFNPYRTIGWDQTYQAGFSKELQFPPSRDYAIEATLEVSNIDRILFPNKYLPVRLRFANKGRHACLLRIKLYALDDSRRITSYAEFQTQTISPQCALRIRLFFPVPSGLEGQKLYLIALVRAQEFTPEQSPGTRIVTSEQDLIHMVETPAKTYPLRSNFMTSIVLYLVSVLGASLFVVRLVRNAVHIRYRVRLGIWVGRRWPETVAIVLNSIGLLAMWVAILFTVLYLWTFLNS